MPPKNAPSRAKNKIPDELVARLAAAGIKTLADWRALSRTQKASVFGVTAAIARQLDAMAAEVAV